MGNPMIRVVARNAIITVGTLAMACTEFPATTTAPLTLSALLQLPDTLFVTDTAVFEVSVKDESGHIVTGAIVSAFSSDTSVLTVEPDHQVVSDVGRFVITARRKGVAEVALVSEGGTGRVDVQGSHGSVVVNERWIGVSVTNGRACGVTANDAAYCWGDGRWGLGDGTLGSSSRPVRVVATGNVVSVSVGPSHACVLDEHGLVYCWGRNLGGEVGDGTQVQRGVPALIAPGSAFRAVAAGDQFTCGITVIGASYCWGDNTFGELGNENVNGDGSCFPELIHVQPCIPSPIDPVRTVTLFGSAHSLVSCADILFDFRCAILLTSISASAPDANGEFACGLTDGGKVFCWGNPQKVGGPLLGQTCFMGRVCSSLATLAGGGANWTTGEAYTGPFFVAVSTGSDACALEQGGRAFCWGSTNGAPTPLATPLRFKSISVGGRHTCALTADGAAYCWGRNDFGQLGNGTTGASTSDPSPVSGGLKFSSIAAGSSLTCAVSVAGPLYCWGRGDSGQLGTADTKSVSTPARVVEPDD